MMRILVTVLLVSFSTSMLTLAMPGPTVDSTIALGRLEAAYTNYGAGSKTFKDTLQSVIDAYNSVTADYEAQAGLIEARADAAEVAGNYSLAGELERKVKVLEALAEGYGDTADMLQEVFDMIIEHEFKLARTWGMVISSLKRTAASEARHRPSTVAPIQPPTLPPYHIPTLPPYHFPTLPPYQPPTLPVPEPQPVPVPEPQPVPEPEPHANKDIQALLESLLASMGSSNSRTV